MATFRSSILAIAVPFLKDFVGERILHTLGTVFDAMNDDLAEGLQARFPTRCPPDALPYLGNDRVIERGPNEVRTSYGRRLQRAFDTWQVAGNAQKMLEALRIYFQPITPPLRAVSNNAIWHSIDNDLAVTRTVGEANWNWDGLDRKWRGWVIIDSTAAPYTAKRYGDGHRYGDGTTYGSSATDTDVANVQRLMRKWKPEAVFNPYIIITFDAALFNPSDTSPPNPNGEFGASSGRLVEALFWLGGN